jgi:hypothetical protein
MARILSKRFRYRTWRMQSFFPWASTYLKDYAAINFGEALNLGPEQDRAPRLTCSRSVSWYVTILDLVFSFEANLTV